MLQALLPLLEALGAEGGTSASLGAGSSVGRTLGRLMGGSSVQAFGGQNELGGALKQISDLTTSLSSIRDAMAEMPGHHEMLEGVQMENEQKFGFRDPVVAEHMATMQREQIERARQAQEQQQRMQELQARAAVTMDPAMQARQARGDMFRRAGALAVGGQAVQSFGPSFLRNLPGVQGAANLFGFAAGETNANIAGQMGNQAAGAVSNVAGTAMKGASIGSMAGPLGAGVGATLGAVVASAGEIAKLPQSIMNWSEALVESQRSISKYNGTLAQAFAEHERRGIVRGIESGRRTGGTTSELSGALDGLRDTLQPIRDNVTNVIAKSLTEMVRLMTQSVRIADIVFLGLKELKFMDIGTRLIAMEGALLAIQNNTRKNNSTQIGQAFEEALKRDKTKMIGVAKR